MKTELVKIAHLIILELITEQVSIRLLWDTNVLNVIVNSISGDNTANWTVNAEIAQITKFQKMTEKVAEDQIVLKLWTKMEHVDSAKNMNSIIQHRENAFLGSVIIDQR